MIPVNWLDERIRAIAYDTAAHISHLVAKHSTAPGAPHNFRDTCETAMMTILGDGAATMAAAQHVAREEFLASMAVSYDARKAEIDLARKGHG